MAEPKVWIRAGIMMMYGSSIDADYHRHHAIQLVWPKPESRCTLCLRAETLSSNGLSHVVSKEIAAPMILASNVEHQLQMEEGWIVLLEPSGELGAAMNQLLAQRPIEMLPKLHFSRPRASDIKLDDVAIHLLSLLEHLKQPSPFYLNNNSNIIDPRIKRLVDELYQCVGVTCLKPNAWRAADVAATLALSESRFLHLFRQEVGIPWRPYLLWCRMICAVEAVLAGQSATEAAYMAGFSDSAHLSRTFRHTFGMTIRQANAVFRRS
ncbi:helix-turn-helix transcriptional regulator [Vibrio sp. ZSDZ65]|uniref:Helix-turn-helix transcriptional regulator n=1 Tax=Vibrio qingdaonensis TaxID=2829491 RepID=A0A9X3CM64_9VIBR|nr:helix-turn-helix transcriptional regulator [Vibrio qingdaonensis]MCW8345941.1 helix-turn-helix transcriptional regulator [Vibrio qingdaonensis]